MAGNVNGMAAAFPKQLTTEFFKMADKVDPLHAAVTCMVSRITDAPFRVSSDKA